MFKGNGYINVSDLRDILKALEDNITDDELDEMISEIDTDGSGTVDFDGTQDWMVYNILYFALKVWYFLEFMEMMSGSDWTKEIGQTNTFL